MSDYIVLDRDGVINVDLMTYVTKPEEFKPIPRSLEAIANLNKNGFKVFIATNQACIEKKIISESQLSEIHNYMEELLKEEGGKIDYIAFCPHAPSTNCSCRKPETGLLEEIENKLNINLQGKYFMASMSSSIRSSRAKQRPRENIENPLIPAVRAENNNLSSTVFWLSMTSMGKRPDPKCSAKHWLSARVCWVCSNFKKCELSICGW